MSATTDANKSQSPDWNLKNKKAEKRNPKNYFYTKAINCMKDDGYKKIITHERLATIEHLTAAYFFLS